MTPQPTNTLTGLLVNTIYAELAQRGGFRWDRTISRYRDNATGRLVPESKVLSTIERFNNGVIQNNVDNLTERFLDGRLTLAQWQQAMALEIKDGWLVSAMAGRGGRNAMTQADWGRLGGRLRYEYSRLNRFADRIKNGELTAAQIRANAQLYALAPRTGYWDGQTAAMIDAGYVAEQRFLGAADHCSICIDLAARGRQPIGTLPEPGTQCEGKRQCKCRKEYFKDFEE
jgi:hypothetical protein